MKLSSNRLERRLQLSGILLIMGLLVEAVCLLWTRPIAFVVFLCVGGLLLGLGIVLTCSPWCPGSSRSAELESVPVPHSWRFACRNDLANVNRSRG
jgi:hypothetical protein